MENHYRIRYTAPSRPWRHARTVYLGGSMIAAQIYLTTSCNRRGRYRLEETHYWTMETKIIERRVNT